MSKSILVSVVMTALCYGCGGDDTLDYTVEPGRIVLDDVTTIDAPAAATVGTDLVVRVTTWGLGGAGCALSDSTDVVVENDRATVAPFDRRRIPHEHETCSLELTPILHEATLAFGSPGNKTIWVQGTGDQGEMVSVPVPLTVQ